MINEFLFSAALCIVLAISVIGVVSVWSGASAVMAFLFLMGLFIAFHTMAIYMLRGGSVLRLIRSHDPLRTWKHLPRWR